MMDGRAPRPPLAPPPGMAHEAVRVMETDLRG